ncbi:hypothetical protein DB347_01760 [Opitutaceae bacterium EW11]|nr:hypothetical protein DB347_01760 [Opitutaceae bacterium EW11]
MPSDRFHDRPPRFNHSPWPSFPLPRARFWDLPASSTPLSGTKSADLDVSSSSLPAIKNKQSRSAIACGIYVVLHLAAQFSAAWFEVAPGISLWYPPAGLALGLLVLLGPRYAPVVFGANVLGALIGHSVGSWWGPIVFPALITANYAGVAWVVRQLVGPVLLPGTRRETVLFGLVMTGAPLLIALAGTAILMPLHVLPPKDFDTSVLLWWAGDVIGLLTVVPAAMAFAGPWLANTPAEARMHLRCSRLDFASIALQTGVLLVSLWLALYVSPFSKYNSLYLCFLPLVWIARSHGLPGATLATLAITMGSLAGVHDANAPTDFTLNLLFFELAVAIVGLGLGCAVSKRNEVERRLAANQALLDRVIAGSQLGTWDWDIESEYITFNRSCPILHGANGCAPSPAPISDSWDRFIHDDDLERVRRLRADHLAGRSSLYEAEYRVRGANGEWRWVYSRGSIVDRDSQSRPVTVSGTYLDITARKNAEAEARRLQQIIETTTDFVITADVDQRILHANQSFLRLLGFSQASDLQGRSLKDVFPEAAMAKLRQEIIPIALAAGACEGELSLRDSAGWEVPVSQVTLAHRDDASKSAALSFVMRDISRQKEAEARNIENERRILQVQKSESLGVLAGGIAHDFNNLLTAMLGYANLSRLELPTGSPVHEWLHQIEIAAERAAELCRQMLAYAGRAPLHFAEVNISALIEETQQLLSVSMGKKIQVQLQLDHSLPAVLAAESEMQQVIMNLALNASEAIGDKEGKILIRTSHHHFTHEQLASQFDAPSLGSGMYVLIEVHDSGCGIPPEMLPRIFEPFFTTKFTGHGLGLAAVMGIVKSHHGVIHVISHPGKGTCFRLLFPALHGSRAPMPKPLKAPAKLAGSGKILVVDDEPGVRGIAGSLLLSFGFTPIFACDGLEGVTVFGAEAANLRCVLLDLTMPRMDGEEAFTEMHRTHPEVPILLMSGYSEKLASERFAKEKPAGFLPKPFDRATLEATLAAVLASQTAAQART